MNLKKKERILAIAFGSLAAIFIMDKLTLSPVLNKLDDLDRQVETGEKDLEKILYIDAQKTSIHESFKKIKAYMETGKTEEDTLAAIMKKIEEMANSCDITLLNMKPDVTREEDVHGYRMKKMSLDTEGSQKDIIRFLYKLENSDYPLSIDDIDFDIKDRATGLMQAELEVSFIYFTD